MNVIVTTENVQFIVKAVNAVVTAITKKYDAAFLTQYWQMYTSWRAQTNDPIDASAFEEKKGVKLAWFRFLFPSIPEKADETKEHGPGYRQDSTYRQLSQTLHPLAVLQSGVEYKKKGAVKVKADAKASQESAEQAVANGEAESTAKAKAQEVVKASVEFQVVLALAARLYAADPAGINSEIVTLCLKLQAPKSKVALIQKAIMDEAQRQADIKAAQLQKSA